jgi:probable rRNA maturation factor
VSFTVFIREERRKLPVPQKKLEKIVRYAFQMTGSEEGDISLVVCDDERITELNEKYKKKNEATDVLAFSMREGEALSSIGTMLGDIVISIDRASRQATELGETLEEEFVILFVHGLLHLLGFDHQNRREESIMQEYTKMIVRGVEQAV